MGIRPLKQMNQALSGKWLWRLGEEQDSPWCQVVVSKYEVTRFGWDILGLSNWHLSLWKGILSIKEAFIATIRFRVRTGEKMHFWLDAWLGDRPLAIQVPDLFSCAKGQRTTVNSYMERQAFGLFCVFGFFAFQFISLVFLSLV